MRNRKFSLILFINLFLVTFPWPNLISAQGNDSTEDLLKFGKNLLSEGKYREALSALTKALDRKPIIGESDTVQFQLSYCRAKLGLTTESFGEFRKAAEKFSDISEYAEFFTAELFESIGSIDSALVFYRKVADLNPKGALSDSAALKTAAIYFQLGQYGLATEFFNRLSNSEALFGLGRVQLELGSYPEAYRTFFNLIRNYTESDWALKTDSLLKETRTIYSPVEWFALALLSFRHKRYDEAIARFSRLIIEDPTNPITGCAQYIIGLTLFSKEDYASAAMIFTQIIEKSGGPGNAPLALLGLARCQKQLDKMTESQDSYVKFAELFPTHPMADDCLWQAGWLAEVTDRFENAKILWSQLVQRYPASEYRTESRWRIGFLLYRQKRYREALKVFSDLEAADTEFRDQFTFWAAKTSQKLGLKRKAMIWLNKTALYAPRSYYAIKAARLLKSPDELQSKTPNLRAASSPLNHKDSLDLKTAESLIALGLFDLAEYELRWIDRDRQSRETLRRIAEDYEKIGLYGQALKINRSLLPDRFDLSSFVSSEIVRKAYPLYYADLVSKYADKNGLDYHLVLAVVRQESLFDRNAISSASALGLMQLLPRTVKEIVSLGEHGNVSERLFEPEFNIRLGCSYLHSMINELGSKEAALAAYNAGPTKAKKWFERLRSRDIDEYIETINLRQTRYYVKEVLKNQWIYTLLYADKSL